MAGKLYGVGIGPGDPELLTLKAYKLIEKSNCIVLPGPVPEETLAYRIVKPLFDNLDEKELVGIAFPMTKDPEVLRKNHEAGAERIIELLEEGKDAVFLTLGDSSVYATYTYVHHIVKARGYATEVIPGITSFCAAAAKTDEPLVENKQMLHVVPASYGVDDALKLPGTKVFMKSGKQISSVVQAVVDAGQSITIVENCGLPGERVVAATPDMAKEEWAEDVASIGYYALGIIKE